MKITVQVKLMPDADQALALSATLRTVNEAANRVSQVAFEHGVPREYELRKPPQQPVGRYLQARPFRAGSR